MFPSYCSDDHCEVCVVFDRCDEFFFDVFCVVFETSSLCIDAIFNASVSSSFFILDTYSLSVIPGKFFLRPLPEWSAVLYKNECPDVYSSDEISAI